MSKGKESTSLVPLNNFDSNIESLRLDDEICLRRISSDELKKLRYSNSGVHSMLWIALTDVKYVLEMSALVQIGGETVILFDHKQPRVSNTILALRLLKTGDVTVSCGFLLDQKGRVSGFTLPPLITPSHNPYFLKQAEIEALKDLRKSLQNVEKDKPYLRFPLFQFTRTFDWKFSVDRIVDFMTIFESIVFHNEAKSIEPAGKVIGISIGMLLGNNQKDRDEMKKMFIKSYSVRNARVHGNVKELKKLQRKHDIGKLSGSMEDYLRRVLKKLIEEEK